MNMSSVAWHSHRNGSVSEEETALIPLQNDSNVSIHLGNNAEHLVQRRY